MKLFSEPMNRSSHVVRSARMLSLAFVAALSSACGDNTSPEDADALPQGIDLNPATLDEATASLGRLDELDRQFPDDPRWPEYRAQLAERLDELNHLVARVEPTPGHTVSFYESEPGSILISESGPMGEGRLLGGEDVHGLSMVELYRYLSGRDAPDALATAEQRRPSPELLEEAALREAALGSEVGTVLSSLQAPELDGATAVGTVQQGLGPNDGPFFQANGCYTSGDFRNCLPNWAGGGFAQAFTKTTFLSMAPFSGNGVTVRITRSSQPILTLTMFNGQWLDFFASGIPDPYSCLPFSCGFGDMDYLKRTIRWDVLNATEDQFHWAFSYKWTCGTQSTCDEQPR